MSPRNSSEWQSYAQSRRSEYYKPIEDDGQEAAEAEGSPETDVPAQKRRDEQEHRQRGQNKPESCLGVIGQPDGVSGIPPQPNHAQNRDKRK